MNIFNRCYEQRIVLSWSRLRHRALGMLV